MIGLLGKKIGMTHRFDENGKFIPVSVLEAGPCFVLQSKDKSLQLAFDKVNSRKVTRPLAGLFKKAGVEPHVFIKEIKVDNAKDYKPGQELKVDVFKEGDFVDVSGVSIGKGFCGGMKRWHWAGGPKTHGHTSHRRVGSIGSSTTPGRVFRGHHMPGHMGNRKVTTQNLKVIKIDSANNLLAVKGAVSGAKNGYLIIRKAKKKK